MALAIAAARADIGRYPYNWGGKSCAKRYDIGLDCSGALRCWLLAADGPDIGWGTWAQLDYCRKHGERVYQPYPAGAVVFLDTNQQDGAPSHVGIASGQRTIIECTARFNGVVETSETDALWRRASVNAWTVL